MIQLHDSRTQKITFQEEPNETGLYEPSILLDRRAVPHRASHTTGHSRNTKKKPYFFHLPSGPIVAFFSRREVTWYIGVARAHNCVIPSTTEHFCYQMPCGLLLDRETGKGLGPMGYLLPYLLFVITSLFFFQNRITLFHLIPHLHDEALPSDVFTPFFEHPFNTEERNTPRHIPNL
ncbi:hypothetical protein B0T20DRAFT_73599 [Sordaria brevicollis]|uniref:Uncharacterized protein n=1 Tax=Sordaria brevicollis TaxID=83679 RepID=A0AAE0U5S7_SORBR|nr:hypothetical protein B0T20DRAFT_73599 [Sordaria brevicollis]